MEKPISKYTDIKEADLIQLETTEKQLTVTTKAISSTLILLETVAQKPKMSSMLFIPKTKSKI